MKDTITDHAVLCWIERRYGVDVEAEREKLRHIVSPYLDLHTINITRDGLKFCIRNSFLVTVLTAEMNGRTGLNAPRPAEAREAAR